MTPDSCGDELYGGEVVFGALVISGCDSSELFDLVEESFNEVPLPIDPARKHERALAVCLRRDVGPGLSLGRLGADCVGVITLIGKQDITFAEVVCQCIGFSAVSNLAAGQTERDWPTFGIDERVDFAREPAAGTSHATIVSIPFFPVAAC